MEKNKNNEILSTKRPAAKSYLMFLVTAGLLIAIEIILERYLEIPIGSISRYSLAFVARAIAGFILGPLGGGIVDVLADVIGATIKFGSPIWLLCITAFLRGAIYGIFLHKRCNILRIILAVLCVEGICSVVFNSFILHYALGTQLSVLFATRGVQAAIMTGVQIPILILMNRYLFPQLHKIYNQYLNR